LLFLSLISLARQKNAVSQTTRSSIAGDGLGIDGELFVGPGLHHAERDCYSTSAKSGTRRSALEPVIVWLVAK
jgi:hypothetical protein